MAKTGLAMPVGTQSGRARLEHGDLQMRKIVSLALSDGESSNPFNGDAGLTVPLFELDNAGTRSLTRRSVQEHFARWQSEERAKLLALQFGSNGAGELTVSAQYTDLETDEARDVSITMRGV